MHTHICDCVLNVHALRTCEIDLASSVSQNICLRFLRTAPTAVASASKSSKPTSSVIQLSFPLRVARKPGHLRRSNHPLSCRSSISLRSRSPAAALCHRACLPASAVLRPRLHIAPGKAMATVRVGHRADTVHPRVSKCRHSRAHGSALSHELSYLKLAPASAQHPPNQPCRRSLATDASCG